MEPANAGAELLRHHHPGREQQEGAADDPPDRLPQSPGSWSCGESRWPPTTATLQSPEDRHHRDSFQRVGLDASLGNLRHALHERGSASLPDEPLGCAIARDDRAAAVEDERPPNRG